MNYRNPIFNRFGTIDCEIEHPIYGWIPFTASPRDVEEHGRVIYEKILEEGNIAPFIPPSEEQLALEAKIIRNRLLSQSDWSQLPDVPQNIKDLWAPYRQALRDLPEQEGFPTDIQWPIPPDQ
jgi:hypothetical protein